LLRGGGWKAAVTKLQIGCNLTPNEGKQLNAHAEAHELSRPRLCALLVLRELNLKRLGELKGRYAGSEPKKGAARVTARISNEEVKTDFSDLAEKCGLGSDDAAAIIFRAELDEHWLSEALRA